MRNDNETWTTGQRRIDEMVERQMRQTMRAPTLTCAEEIRAARAQMAQWDMRGMGVHS